MKRTLASALAILALSLTTGCSFSVSSKPSEGSEKSEKVEKPAEEEWLPVTSDSSYDGYTKEIQRKLKDGREVTCLVYSRDRGAGIDCDWSTVTDAPLEEER